MDHPWFVLGVLLGNGIGSLLAVFCLVRMTDQQRSVRNRLLLVLVAAWALVETARDDMLFVAATTIHMSDYEVHFFLAPSMGLTAIAVLFTMAVFWFTAAHPRPLWTIGGGIAAGLLMTAMSLQAAFSGRTDSATSIDIANAAMIAAGLGVTTGIAVWLGTGATTRQARATAVTLLTVGLTITQYLISAEVTTDPSTTVNSDLGINPVQLAVFTAVAFGVRAIALTFMTMIEEGRPDPAADQFDAHGFR
ncbi:hypothetical protein [Dactylosporangium salmoneum]|uniref:MHYT domain-containing protein n=1 Tax=Dactylosporangium salmoneum TaxID=53361 RepID=A0ABP5URY8_9ACTN